MTSTSSPESGDSISAPSGGAASSGRTSTGVYPIYILILLLLATTLSYADRHLFSVLMPAIQAEFQIEDGALGLIAGPGFVISFVLLSMPLARLADRWSRPKVLAISAGLWSLATAACGLATGVATMTTARVMVGVGEAGGMPPSQAIIAQIFPVRARATALGVLAAGTYFGLVLGLAGGGAIASEWGWRTAFLALAAPGIPLALLIWFTGPKREPAPTQTAAPRDASQRRDSMITAVRQCWAIPSLRLLAIGVGVFNVYGYAGAIWLPSYFIRSHGMSAAEAGAWLGFGAAVGGVIGSFASGIIVDALSKHDERWRLRVPSIGFLLGFPLTIVILLLPGGAAVTLFGAQVPGVALVTVLTAFLTSLWMAPSFAVAARLVAPERRAQATALLVVIINVMGTALGPVIAGFVSEALTVRFENEALRYSLLTMSVLIAVGGLIFWRASTHYGRDLATSGPADA